MVWPARYEPFAFDEVTDEIVGAADAYEALVMTRVASKNDQKTNFRYSSENKGARRCAKPV